jgi:diamine N-acetyltransferase
MIYGEHIRLRAIERSDLPVFVKWLNDSEIAEGINIYRPLSLTDEDEWFDQILKHQPDEHPFVIEVNDGGEGWKNIGTINFQTIEWRVRCAEVGIFIGDKTYWNRGLGSEAMRLMVGYGFDTLNLHRIQLRVYSKNKRAIRSYEKVGFVLEGRLRQNHYLDGNYIDTLLMGILREEYISSLKR